MLWLVLSLSHIQKEKKGLKAGRSLKFCSGSQGIKDSHLFFRHRELIASKAKLVPVEGDYPSRDSHH